MEMLTTEDVQRCYWKMVAREFMAWPDYDSFDREGSSTTARYLRIGRDGGSRIEVGERGFYLRLGRAVVTFRWRWRGEQDDA